MKVEGAWPKWKLKGEGSFQDLKLADQVNAIAEGRAVKVNDIGDHVLDEASEPPQWKGPAPSVTDVCPYCGRSGRQVARDGHADNCPKFQPTAEKPVMKYDGGKTRLELFPGDALYAISDILTFGAKKYADRGWEKGMEWSRVFGALQRHMWAWWGGEKFDSETKKSHLWHAGCCIVFLIAYEIRGIGKDDRPGKLT